MESDGRQSRDLRRTATAGLKGTISTEWVMEHMTFFFAEIGLMNYLTIIEYNPSKLSASAVYVARCTLNKSPLWTETLKHYTGYSEDQLVKCAKMLVSFHAGLRESQMKAISRKYSNPERFVVSMIPSDRNLLTV